MNKQSKGKQKSIGFLLQQFHLGHKLLNGTKAACAVKCTNSTEATNLAWPDIHGVAFGVRGNGQETRLKTLTNSSIADTTRAGVDYLCSSSRLLLLQPKSSTILQISLWCTIFMNTNETQPTIFMLEVLTY